MIDFINLITFLWLSFWLILFLNNLKKGYNSSIYFVYIVFYVFFAVPIFLDVLIGKPLYYDQPGFRLASSDDYTSIIYCIYVSIIPVIWWLTARVRKEIRKMDFNIFSLWIIKNKNKVNRIKLILLLLLISPLLVLFFAPKPSMYLNYAVGVGDISFLQYAYYHSFISLASNLSIISAGGIFLLNERIRASIFVFLIPFLSISIWLNGKRAIVALTILLIGFVFWSRGYLKGSKLIVGLIFGVTVMSIFNTVYQDFVRNEYTSSISSQLKYEHIRVDYGRDDKTKMTIYSQLYPDRMKILEYRGETILFNLFFFIPRELWPDKPWPYSIYFTSAMLEIPTQSLSWGMTTSWLEEAIANLGWLGMIIGPLTFSYVCRLGDSSNNLLIKGLTIIVGCLILVVQFAAFAPLIIVWISSIIFYKLKKPKIA